MPKYYAELLQFYWKNLRPLFVTKKKNAIAYFVDEKGEVLGKYLI
jgi:hypothetical protein